LPLAENVIKKFIKAFQMLGSEVAFKKTRVKRCFPCREKWSS